MTVLVTGGAGFIGSHTVAALRAAGRRVVVVDDFSTGRRENLAEWAGDPEVEVVAADVRDDSFKGELAGRGPFAAVVHLAAQVSVVRSLADPVADLDVNLRATTRLALWAVEAGAQRFVFASSAAVYGEPRRVPIAEDDPIAPISPYGAAKAASELYLGCLAPLRSLACVSLRFFNVYGPRQDPQSPYAGVVAAFLSRALRGEPLTIFGAGTQTRDFVYVEDVARAVVLALGTGSVGHTVCNVASGREISVLELAEQARQAAQQIGASPGALVHVPARAGEIDRSLAATGRAAELLGFRAATGLEEGLRRTAAWLAGQP